MKVAIIGAGNVGATAALRIVEANLADIVLMDIVEGKAEGLALDLSSASSIVGHSRSILGTTDYKEISGANIVVLTAGQARSPGQSREELLSKNAEIAKDASRKIVQYAPSAIVIVVSNPLDVLTYLTLKATKFSPAKIIGMGGVSDCARFNMLIGNELNIAGSQVQSVIIGPHADNMVILPRLTTVKGKALNELLSEKKIEEIVGETRNFGARIVKLLGKGSAYYGPSAGIFALVDSIVNDRKKLLCASSYLSGQYGLSDLCLGVPVKIGAGGIEEIVELELTDGEKSALMNSAASIKNLIKKIRSI
ncbi:MAG: malate dehydrogenase [Candidatus Omnitrophota bacterium]|nr:MAG: malate dehydrogenase [Candidatus Omnitrophota bacterium]